MKFRFLIVLTSLLSFGCSTSVEYYKGQNPKLDFQKFFNGPMVAHGFYKDRFNKVKKTFVVEMNVVWINGNGTLTEHFTYNDGSKFERIWNLKIEGDKVFGTASDVVGVAEGEISGNALHWIYDVDLSVDGAVYRVKFDDWMYQVDQSTLLNQSYMSKWGTGLGEVVLSIRKK